MYLNEKAVNMNSYLHLYSTRLVGFTWLSLKPKFMRTPILDKSIINEKHEYFKGLIYVWHNRHKNVSSFINMYTWILSSLRQSVCYFRRSSSGPAVPVRSWGWQSNFHHTAKGLQRASPGWGCIWTRVQKPERVNERQKCTKPSEQCFAVKTRAQNKEGTSVPLRLLLHIIETCNTQITGQH